MRIVFLITFGAFLLSISIAENDVSIGTPEYIQRLHRSVVLEPVVKYQTKSEGNPVSWFLNMVSRVLVPSKKTSSAMIGPIRMPGMGGHVYVKQVESSGMPWESNRIVIRMMRHDPVIENMAPGDSSSTYHRTEGSAKRIVKPYGHQMTKIPMMRPNAMIKGYQPSSVSPQHTSWSSYIRPPIKQYSSPYVKSAYGSSPNNFRYDNYGKDVQSFSKGYTNNEYGPPHSFHNNYQQFQPNSGLANRDPTGPITSIPPATMYRSIGHETPNDSTYRGNYQHDLQFKSGMLDFKRHEDNFYPNDSRKPDSVFPTQVPYPVYPPLRENQPRPISPLKDSKVSETSDVNYSESSLRSSDLYGQVVRADRMVSAFGNYHNQFEPVMPQGRTAHSQSFQQPAVTRGFHQASVSKFDADDFGGIKMISPPNLKNEWKSKPVVIADMNTQYHNSSTYSKISDTGLNQDEDSISIGDGKSLARGESAEHVKEEIDNHSILSRSGGEAAYARIIDRSNKNQNNQKISSDSSISGESFEINRMDETNKNMSIASNNRTNENQPFRDNRQDAKMNNVTAEVVQKVVNLTASNHWRFQERRAPRVVKAVYRRKPTIDINKANAESSESANPNFSREDQFLSESSIENLN